MECGDNDGEDHGVDESISGAGRCAGVYGKAD